MSDDELVCIGTSVDTVVLEATRASLEARGIDVWIHGQNLSAMVGVFERGSIAARVMVKRRDAALATTLAQEVMGALDGPALEEDDGDDSEGDAAPKEALAKPKSAAIPVLLAMCGLGLGLSHMYARRTTMGAVLIIVAIFAVGLVVGGQPLGRWVLAAVWIVDLVGGLAGVAAYNRQLSLPSAPST